MAQNIGKSYWATATGGTVAAITATIPGLDSLKYGDIYTILTPIATTGALTIDINGLGAVPVKTPTSADPAAMPANYEMFLIWNTSEFVLQNNPTSASGPTAEINSGWLFGTVSCSPISFALRSSGTGCGGYTESNYTNNFTHPSVPAPATLAPAGYKWVADVTVWYAMEYKDIINPFNIVIESAINGAFVGIYNSCVFPVKPQQTTLYVAYTVVGAEINQAAPSSFVSTIVSVHSNGTTPATCYTQVAIPNHRMRYAYRLQKI